MKSLHIAHFPSPKLCFGEMSVVKIQSRKFLKSLSELQIILTPISQKTLGLFLLQSIVHKLILKSIQSQFDIHVLFLLNNQYLFAGDGVI